MLMRVATARTCPVISSPARCRSRCMLDAASSSRNTSILLSSHVRLGTWQVFHPLATELGCIRTADGGNSAVFRSLSPLAVPLLLEPGCQAPAFLRVVPGPARRLRIGSQAGEDGPRLFCSRLPGGA